MENFIQFIKQYNFNFFLGQLTRQIVTAKSFLSMQNFEFKIYNTHSFNKEITRNHVHLRSGHEMITMAEVYRKEANHEAAYVLYLKYITLFVEKLKTHPDYNQIQPTDKKKAKNEVRTVYNISKTWRKNGSSLFW